MTSDRSPNQRRSPKQARSRATWEAIVEAASQILERHGPEALNTQAVAERAGVSIGTLYQYFPDKQAILAAAARREFSEEAAPLAGRQRALVQALISMVETVGRLGTGSAARMAKQQTSTPRAAPARRTRRPPTWDTRCADLAGLLVELVAPSPALIPIPIRARRRVR
jgi:AcrR family transcriptional regulator